MNIGETVITKEDGKIIECKVIDRIKDLLKLNYNGTIIFRKSWEVNKKH